MSELILKRAYDSIQKRNYDYAKELLYDLVTKDPDNMDARRLLYESCTKKIEMEGKSAIKVKFLQTKTAAELKLQKNPVKRVEICQKLLLEDPLNSKIRVLLGETLTQAGFVKGAIAELKLVIEREEFNTQALKSLALALQLNGKIQEAQTVLERAASIATEDREIHKMLKDTSAQVTMDKGFQEVKDLEVITEGPQGQEQQSRSTKPEIPIQTQLVKLTDEFQQNPSDKSAKRIADFFMDMRKDYNKASEWYKKALSINPQDTTLKDKIEDCEIKTIDNKIIEAEKENDPKIMDYKRYKLKKEISIYERRIADRPTDTSTRYELGRRYLTAGGDYLDKAVAQFQQTVKDPKKKIDSHYYLSLCFRKKKMYDLADNQLQRAEEASSTDHNRLLEIWYQRAHVNAEAGNFTKGVEFGKKILELDINYKDIAKLIQKWQTMQQKPGDIAGN